MKGETEKGRGNGFHSEATEFNSSNSLRCHPIILCIAETRNPLVFGVILVFVTYCCFSFPFGSYGWKGNPMDPCTYGKRHRNRPILIVLFRCLFYGIC